MKRLTALALGLAFALLAVVPALADRGAPKWVLDPTPIKWRTSTNTLGNDAEDLLGYADSNYFSNGATTQSIFDTTVAIALGSCEVPFHLLSGSGAGIDSVWFCSFAVQASAVAGQTAGLDSVLLQAQVSNDAVNWTSQTPTWKFDATRTAGNALGAIVVASTSTTTSSGFIWPYDQIIDVGGGIARAGGSGSGSPTDQNWLTWKFVRFIVGGGGATGAFIGQFYHWAYDNQ